MKVLCVGLSSIMARRVLPALAGLPGISAIELVSRRGPPPEGMVPHGVRFLGFDFANALLQSNAECVYISTVNSEHAGQIRAALDAGRHVIVDKPAVLTLAEAEALVALARRKRLVLAEATVYAAHNQVAMCRSLFDSEGGPKRIATLFSVPPLAPENFRYRRDEGGGSLFDQGPYAVSLGRIFFGTAPDMVACRITARHKDSGVDTAFSMMAVYPGGHSMNGHFGFDTEYHNEVTLLGGKVSLTMQRFFTTPVDLPNTLHVRRGNIAESQTARAEDSFAAFFALVLDACRDPGGADAARLSDDLLADAAALAVLRRSAEADVP